MYIHVTFRLYIINYSRLAKAPGVYEKVASIRFFFFFCILDTDIMNGYFKRFLALKKENIKFKE